MADCTRTRRIRPLNPIHAALLGRQWDAEQARQTAFIAAEEAARAVPAFAFSRDDAECFYAADGTPVQLGMRVWLADAPAASASALVLLDCRTGEWSVLLPIPLPCTADALVTAVRDRIEANRRERDARYVLTAKGEAALAQAA